MSKNHPHSAVIDALGMPPIMGHFQISRQAVWYWRKRGVPKRHQKTLAMLGLVAGVDVSGLLDTSPPAAQPLTQKEV